MQETDIDDYVEKKRARAEGLTTEEYRAKLCEELRGFRDAIEGDPVLAAEFLSYLDLDPLEGFLAGLYRRAPEYPAPAMLRTALLFDLLKMAHYPDVERHLQTHPEQAVMLGFPCENGAVLTPKWKNVWHFDQRRVGGKWEQVFVLLRGALVSTGRKLGLRIGEKTMQDATPIEALEHDTEAKYNGHYKINGYKLDTTDDLEHAVPLAKLTTCINHDEAKNLVPELEELKSAGIVVEEHTVDCGYTDYEQLAWMGVNGIKACYRMAENWVHNEKGELPYLEQLYQKFWQDPEFRPGAPTEYVLRFLFERGCIEEVGAYFRNPVMAKYHADPDGHMKEYHKRSRKEGNHGYWKEHLGIESRLRVKGRARVDRFLTRNLCAVLAVALTRLQHGVRTGLTSVAFLT